ncbi:MAG: glutathione S-transferase, partial [Alphaproteobacteria bacterium CG_4_9_14_3_um_filter_47_13]
FIRQCAFVDRTWYEGLDCPNLQRWLQEHLESLLFQIIMKKRELWTPEALPTLLFSL